MRIVTEEAINEILKKQHMVGAIRIFKSFLDFKGKVSILCILTFDCERIFIIVNTTIIQVSTNFLVLYL